MADVQLQTYNSAGTYTFTATTNGLHRFHVIGSGGDGQTPNSSRGGTGGGGGGYAIHEVMMAPGETAGIEITKEKTTLSCKEALVEATAGQNNGTAGKATGANNSNLDGATGYTGGSDSHSGSNSEGQMQESGGWGGSGAPPVGKYQGAGGSGGRGGVYNRRIDGEGHWYVTQSSSAGAGAPGTPIGGAGGGGGGRMGTPTSGKGGAGNIGGVVVEFVNTAPTAPPYIDAGDHIVADKESTISWGASTDTNGNLTGYVLERSVDSGAWTETYRGASRNITDTISSDWITVQYRVKAYDAEGAESGYVSTEKLTVVHNSPPSAPSSINLPSEIHGGTNITVSWGRATDADNNLTGYTLEQCVNSGDWTEIKNTTEISAEVPITYGWQTIQFRVRAYDSYGAVGEYTASAAVTVINNRPPVISGEDRDLGTIIDVFEPQTYVVTDADGDAVTVEILLDGVRKDSFTAELGAENRLELTPEEWQKVLNGPHTWTITATDAQQAAVTRTITFTKKVASIRFRLAQPLTADAMPEKLILSYQGACPDGAQLTIEACNNGFDEVPDWEDITNKVLTGQKHFFRNAEKTAERWGIGIRVTLDRGSAEGECYIHSHRGNYA